MSSIPQIRPSPIAGSWYSNDPVKLRSEINSYLDHATVPELTEKVIGVISPHAGYFYSGSTAGYAYKAVKDMDFDLCVVASPLHDYLPYPFISSAHQSYHTPLGDVEIASELLAEFNNSLQNTGLDGLQLIANDREHSLEIQLPFLQVALSKPFSLIPLMIRTHDPQILEKAARKLADLIKNKKVLLVASTDLSHFYNEKTANTLDNVMLNQMTDFSPSGVLNAEANEAGFACGAGAVAFVLWTALSLGAKKVNLLHHTTSAQASRDTSSVVGYGALSITE